MLDPIGGGCNAASIARALGGRRSGRGYIAKCPAHNDTTPSLSILERDGVVLAHCFSGCTQQSVIEALRRRGLWRERPRPEWTAADRERWLAERRDVERYIPDARLWRRAAANLAEDALAVEKARLFDPNEEPADVNAIRDITGMLSRLRAMGDATLVAHYREWQRDYPALTWTLVETARRREREEARALARFLGFPASVAAKYSPDEKVSA